MHKPEIGNNEEYDDIVDEVRAAYDDDDEVEIYVIQNDSNLIGGSHSSSNGASLSKKTFVPNSSDKND